LKVTGVIPGGASDRAGLKAGDFISKVAGFSFRRDMTLPMLQKKQMEIASGQMGLQLKMTIIRDGKPMEMTIDLRPGSR
jgi:C-terminal processing protease CtpA/Prc